MLLFSPDLGTLATLEVLLEPAAAVDTASSQVSAFAIVGRTTPSLAIFDLGSDPMAGVSILHAATLRHPGLRSVVIVPGDFQRGRLLTPGHGGLQAILIAPCGLGSILETATAVAAVALPVFRGSVLRALEYIRGHYAEPLATRGVARSINVSFSCLAHRFRTDLGLSIREYLMRMRAHAARHLIAESGLKLERVAEAAGFSDASHLSRIFKSTFGERPGRHRSRWRPGSPPGAEHPRTSGSTPLGLPTRRSIAGRHDPVRPFAVSRGGAAPGDHGHAATGGDSSERTYGLLGIGFGPSNIALAIALEELIGRSHLQAKVLFLEKQTRTRWHPGMLLPATTLQVAFLKDLVALRNPTSRYTFVNFLRQVGRLDEFVNLRTAFAHRLDFAQYVEWVAEQFRDVTRYGESVRDVTPIGKGRSALCGKLQVTLESGASYITRSLALATGGQPHVPDVFQHVLGDLVFHSSEYLDRMPPAGTLAGKTVAIVGGGQSAAEIVNHLAGHAVKVICILRDFALRAADDSHFLNEVFLPRWMDYTYRLSRRHRDGFLASLRSTNYGVVDPELIESLYRLVYEARLRGEEPVCFVPHTVVERARLSGGGVELVTRRMSSGEHCPLVVDYVVLATGYRRLPLPACVEGLRPYIRTDERGRPGVGRDFRLDCQRSLDAPIYLLGFAEHTHGIGDTLLSLAAHRAAVVARSMVRHLGAGDVRAAVGDVAASGLDGDGA